MAPPYRTICRLRPALPIEHLGAVSDGRTGTPVFADIRRSVSPSGTPLSTRPSLPIIASTVNGPQWWNFSPTATLMDGAKTNWDVMPEMQVTISPRQHIRADIGVRAFHQYRRPCPASLLLRPAGLGRRAFLERVVMDMRSRLAVISSSDRPDLHGRLTDETQVNAASRRNAKDEFHDSTRCVALP